jgi:hypothetical protein
MPTLIPSEATLALRSLPNWQKPITAPSPNSLIPIELNCPACANLLVTNVARLNARMLSATILPVGDMALSVS